MKRYVVIFETSAQDDVRRSYDWGSRIWGKKEHRCGFVSCAQQSQDNSASCPNGFPLAPEDDEFSEKIRQMVVGRYRVLFTIKKR